MGCGTNVVRYLFFAFNFIFFILGIAVLAVGIYSRVENDTWRDLIDSDTFFEAANLLIAAGVFVAIIGFLGCCGAIQKWTWMLIGYAILVILIFILEIAAGAYAYSKRDKIQSSLETKLTKGVHLNYGQSGTASKGITKAIDWFQRKVKCCGAVRPEDWKDSKWYTSKNYTGLNKPLDVPISCCKTETTGCNTGLAKWNSDKLNIKGCVAEGKKYAKDNLWLIGGVGVGIAVVELLGIIFSLLLCKSFKDDEAGTTA